jgi:hypothetical protein
MGYPPRAVLNARALSASRAAVAALAIVVNVSRGPRSTDPHYFPRYAGL